MYSAFFYIFPLLAAISTPLAAILPVTPYKVKATYNSLDPQSIVQHLAFYELYHNDEIGKTALRRAWQLMNEGKSKPIQSPLLHETIQAMISLINKDPLQKASDLNEGAITAIEQASKGLENRKLKGHFALDEEDVLALQPEEIDLAHAIFLSQKDRDADAFQSQRNYEAAIDLMALQIRARLPQNAKPEQIIRAMNDFIFFELGFRFPPHSLYELAVDHYTFLSSVIDSRRGICLGVSILYISLAQRLGLLLEIVTPPGHIFVRYRNGDSLTNIETTARGIHIQSTEYLTLDTCALHERNLKEIVGFVYFNQAADDLREGNFARALEAYKKAKLYISEDPLLDELTGICYILTGQEEMGRDLLQRSLKTPDKHRIGRSPSCEDYLAGVTDAEGLKALFVHVDEKRESVLKQQKSLQEIIQRLPRFRAGLSALAMTWVQLHRLGEALEVLEKYHQLDPNDPKIEYYLAAIYAERLNTPKAWEHLQNAERITRQYDYQPKTLREFRKELSLHSPEP